jgi:lysophospholipase L1-like esterase
VRTLLIFLVLCSMGASQRIAAGRWVVTWFAAPAARTDQPASQGLMASPLHIRNQTLRQVAHVSLGGPRLRVVVANTFGAEPLAIGAASVALRARDAAIVPGSGRPLTFSGASHGSVPPGAMLTSDPVAMAVPDLSDVVVDLYLPGDTAASGAPVTAHLASWQTNYVSAPGNFAGSAAFPVQATTTYRRPDGLDAASSFFLARIEVEAPPTSGAIIALGDSITDGTQSMIDTNNRWPDHLARRLQAAGIRMAVANAGIGGNRLLADGNGPAALARFDRDVLAQPGATHLVVLEGINDIGRAGDAATPSAPDLIAALRELATRAHARGLKTMAATLTPFEGADYFTAAGEAKRQALNEWIRHGGAFDGVLDFDAVVRDPEHPARLRPAFDPGDHLHLNADGYRAVAGSIDLSLFL